MQKEFADLDAEMDEEKEIADQEKIRETKQAQEFEKLAPEGKAMEDAFRIEKGKSIQKLKDEETKPHKKIMKFIG